MNVEEEGERGDLVRTDPASYPLIVPVENIDFCIKSGIKSR